MALFVALALISVVLKCFPYVVEIVFYVLAAVTLSVGSFYLVLDIKYGIKEIIKPGIEANPYTSRVVSDYRLRTILFAIPGLAGNMILAVLNGITGIISHSAWFGSLSAYYILLSVMRIGAVRQERKIHKIKQNTERILLAIPGFIGWILPYFLYKRIVGKQTEKLTPLIEEKYDEIYEICEKGNKLLY